MVDLINMILILVSELKSVVVSHNNQTNQWFSFDYPPDEFSSQDEDDEVSSKTSVQAVTKKSSVPAAPIILSRCKALYSYSPKLYDELELNPGMMSKTQ